MCMPQVNPEDFPQCGASLMPWLTSLPHLRDLSLQGVPQDWASHASGLAALRTLSLAGYNINNDAPHVLFCGLTCITGLVSLQVSDLQGFPCASFLDIYNMSH